MYNAKFSNRHDERHWLNSQVPVTLEAGHLLQHASLLHTHFESSSGNSSYEGVGDRLLDTTKYKSITSARVMQ